MKSRILNSLFAIGFSLFIYSCVYDVVVPLTVNDTISFQTDVLPIFVQSCNQAGCHNTGGAKPDLTPTNAYQSLISGKYIDTSNPEISELYLWMKGDKSIPMPLSGPNANYNAIILAWIQQGAPNN